MIIIYVMAFLALIGSLVMFFVYQEEKLENLKRTFENTHQEFRLESKKAYVRPAKRRLHNRQKRNRN
tara:strand:- start:11401 stop:11601 length:201 start_codon:yes stop_codon:yes gene_type:complete